MTYCTNEWYDMWYDWLILLHHSYNSSMLVLEGKFRKTTKPLRISANTKKTLNGKVTWSLKERLQQAVNDGESQVLKLWPSMGYHSDSQLEKKHPFQSFNLSHLGSGVHNPCFSHLPVTFPPTMDSDLATHGPMALKFYWYWHWY